MTQAPSTASDPPAIPMGKEQNRHTDTSQRGKFRQRIANSRDIDDISILLYLLYRRLQYGKPESYQVLRRLSSCGVEYKSPVGHSPVLGLLRSQDQVRLSQPECRLAF